MIAKQIEDYIAQGLNAVPGTAWQAAGRICLEHPKNLEHGDYSTAIALVLAKEQGIKPHDLAEAIAAALRELQPDCIARVEVAPHGFINFFLSDSFFVEAIRESIAHGTAWGKTNLYKGQRTLIEYTDPNPFKELHIGHLMSNTIGEALSRIIEANGAEVKRANYQGDVGLHVAKTVWEMQRVERNQVAGKRFPSAEASLSEKAQFLGSCYALAAAMYEANLEEKKQIDDLNKIIYERSDLEINRLYDWGRKVSLEYFEEIYKKLGTKFDFYFFESTTGPFGKNSVEKNIGPVFEKSAGAVIFPGEKHDAALHTRVFITKEGLPTYEAKELGLAKLKYDAYPYERSIVVTANEINDYFRVLLAAMSLVFPDLAAKTVHIGHGMMKLPTGKMSSRTGDVITAESFIAEVHADVLEKMAAREIPDKESIADDVAIAAIKYAILKQSPGRDIIFDQHASLSFEGDSGPYLQYAHTRALSVLEKAEKTGFSSAAFAAHEPACALERLLYRFPEVVERAGAEYAPQHLATYLIDLAGVFNSYYAKNTIVDPQDKERSAYRLALTRAFASTMRNGLALLGIKAPRRM